jgi:hypothetical protein
MSPRTSIRAAGGIAAAAFLLAVAPAGAAPQVPPGATVSDGIVCHDGGPAWRVFMANSGPDVTIDYTVQADGGTKADYDVAIGAPVLQFVPAKSGGSHLTVLADSASMIDTTDSISCGQPTTTTTTAPPVHTTTTTVPATTPTTVHTNGAALPADPPPPAAPTAVHAAATTQATLPFTGSSSLPIALTGFALVGAGGALLLSERARKTRRS